MTTNDNLFDAKETKNDEFYTQITDIQDELSHYTDKFKDKVIYCNCDDPFESNFVRYFIMNFNRLGLKRLLASGFQIGDNKDANTSYILNINNTSNYLTSDNIDLDEKEVNNLLQQEKALGRMSSDITWVPSKKYSNPIYAIKQPLYCEPGDFRSTLSLDLLQESDIVVTNPPFSLFRDYISLLMAYQKQFLIIGNLNAVTYKEFFPLLKDNKAWMGFTQFIFGSGYFVAPKELYDPQKMANPRNGYIENGQLYWRVNGVRWLTNLDHPQRHQFLTLNKDITYKNNESNYPKYNDFDAINIDKISDIPCDYMGCMGVPITFLDKYCPEQFDILGIANSSRCIGDINCHTIIGDKKIYNRIIIKRKI